MCLNLVLAIFIFESWNSFEVRAESETFSFFSGDIFVGIVDAMAIFKELKSCKSVTACL